MKGRWLLQGACGALIVGCGVEVKEANDGYKASDSRNEFALMLDNGRDLQLTTKDLGCVRGEDSFTLSYRDKSHIADGLDFSLVMIGKPREGLTIRSSDFVSGGAFQMTINFADGESYLLDQRQMDTFATLTFTRVTDFAVAGRLWVENLRQVGQPPIPSAPALGIRASFECVRFN